jgi:hypothetical protein
MGKTERTNPAAVKMASWKFQTNGMGKKKCIKFACDKNRTGLSYNQQPVVLSW